VRQMNSFFDKVVDTKPKERLQQQIGVESNDDEIISLYSQSYFSSEDEVVFSDSSSSEEEDDDDDDDRSINSFDAAVIHRNNNNVEQRYMIPNPQGNVSVDQLFIPNRQYAPIHIPQHPNVPQIDRNTIIRSLREIHDSSLPTTPALLLRIARSEEIPLIRAEIDWTLFATQLEQYPAHRIGDIHGAYLLQSILRMDPPLSIVRETLRLFPKSCINMDSFYTACQYSNPNKNNDDNTIVQLLIRRTMKARRKEGIQWGMLAFLGDARIRPIHAKCLLSSIPEAVVEDEHGMFGVSPLDRMISGAFIHGEHGEWVEKLKLALWTAEKGSLDGWKDARMVSKNISNDHEWKFYPFHALVNRLIEKEFKGTHFGLYSFMRTLVACLHSTNTQQQRHSPPFHQFDNKENLPLHVVLREECYTSLGVKGERRLIKFLLGQYPESAWIPDGIDGKLPLRLAIKNGWPCHDIIIGACHQYCESLSSSSTSSVSKKKICTNLKSIDTTTCAEVQNYEQNDIHGKSILHTVLGGPYHKRYGIFGARSLVRYVLKKNPASARMRDLEGRLHLHVAIEHGWPCHDLLINAAPLALETRDVKTGFYPFQIAAVCSSLFCNGGHDGEKQEVVEEEVNANAIDDDSDIGSCRGRNLMQLNMLYELIREGPMIFGFWENKEKNTAKSTGDENKPSSSLLATTVMVKENEYDGGGKKKGLSSASLRKRKRWEE